MRTKILITFFICAASVIAALSFKAPAQEAELLFHQQMAALMESLYKLDVAREAKRQPDTLKSIFLETRLAYKKASTMVDYFFPTLRKSINGADLKYAEDDNPDLIYEPHGFQVMERIIYGDEPDFEGLESEISALSESFKSMDQQPGLDFKLRSELMFDAMKASVIRMISLGITGFDSPIAMLSIKETEAALTGIAEILNIYNDAEGRALVTKPGKT